MASIMMVNKLGEWDDDEYDDDDEEEEEEDGSSALISPSMSSTGSVGSTSRDELSPRPRPRSCQRRKRRKRRQANHRCRPNKKRSQSQSQGNSSSIVMALSEELEHEICNILRKDLPSTDHDTIFNGLRKLSDLCQEGEKACAKKFIRDNDGIGLMRHIMASAMNKLSSSSTTIEDDSEDDADDDSSSSTNSILHSILHSNHSDDTGDRLGCNKHAQVAIVAAGIQVLMHLITSDHDADEDDHNGGGSGGGSSGWEEVEVACLKMHRLGALDLVLQAMTQFVHNCNMQLVACSFWNKYAACSKKCAKIVVGHHHHRSNNNNNNCAVIPAILQAMKHHPNHKQLQTCAIRAISTICTQTPSQGGGGSGAASVYKAGGFSALVRTVETIELDEETTKLAKKAIAQLNSYLQKNDTYACVLARA